MNSTVKRISPGSTIGIIGGGQLGKMLAQSALRMGYKVACLTRQGTRRQVRHVIHL